MFLRSLSQRAGTGWNLASSRVVGSTRTTSSLVNSLSLQNNYNNYNHGNRRRRRHEQDQEHSTSAVAAPQFPDPEDDEETFYDTKSPPVVIHTIRPRLQALREQLKQEPPLPSFLNSNHNNNNKTAANSMQQPKTSNKKVIHWRDLLDRSRESPPLSPVVHPDDNSVVLDARAATTSQKVLTDRFGRHHNYLRISLAERCNLRCTYCMPPEGVPLQPQSQLLQTPEILALARHFQNHGVNKIRLTGGEPTLRSDLVDILEGLSSMGEKGFDELAITTNGVTLAKNLEAYLDAGLNRVNISLDTLYPQKFETLTRRPAAYFHRVWESIEAATAIEPDRLITKINVVVMKGVNDDEIADFCALQTRFPNLHVRFIEYMPFTENGWNMDKWVPYKELLQQLEQQDQVQLVKLPEEDPNDTTKWYTTVENSLLLQQRTNGSDHANGSSNSSNNNNDNQTTGIGKIGFITSMSQPFCGTCNRLRLTSDGQIKVCLFDGNSTVSLRDALREGADADSLDRLIQHALRKKHYSLGGHDSPEHILRDSDHNRPMTLIGG